MSVYATTNITHLCMQAHSTCLRMCVPQPLMKERAPVPAQTCAEMMVAYCKCPVFPVYDYLTNTTYYNQASPPATCHFALHHMPPPASPTSFAPVHTTLRLFALLFPTSCMPSIERNSPKRHKSPTTSHKQQMCAFTNPPAHTATNLQTVTCYGRTCTGTIAATPIDELGNPTDVGVAGTHGHVHVLVHVCVSY